MSDSELFNLQETGWVSWFCSLEEHSFLVEVEPDFLNDPFNHYGLKKLFPRFNEALQVILSPEIPEEDEDSETRRFGELYHEAVELYGLLHSRYLETSRGMALIREKHLNGVFGTCPRVLCGEQKVFPLGLSEKLKHSKVKIFCPACEEIYVPSKKYQDVDGAFFGTSLPHVFLKIFPELHCDKKIEYVPRLNGFRLFNHKGSKFSRQIEATKTASDKPSQTE